MAIVIEDGSIVSGANSYILESEFNDYVTLRGYTVTASVEPLLIRSYDYMSTLNWIESHTEAFTVTGNIKSAQAEIAYRLSTGLDPSAKPVDAIKRKKVDVLETEFFASSNGMTGTDFLNYMPQAKGYLTGLITFRIDRLVKA